MLQRCRSGDRDTGLSTESLQTTVATEPLTPQGRNKENHLLTLELGMKVEDPSGWPLLNHDSFKALQGGSRSGTLRGNVPVIRNKGVSRLPPRPEVCDSKSSL